MLSDIKRSMNTQKQETRLISIVSKPLYLFFEFRLHKIRFGLVGLGLVCQVGFRRSG